MKLSSCLPFFGPSKNKDNLNNIIKSLPEFKGDNNILELLDNLPLNQLSNVEQKMIINLGNSLNEMKKSGEPLPVGLLLQQVNRLYSNNTNRNIKPSKVMDQLTALCSKALDTNWTSDNKNQFIG